MKNIYLIGFMGAGKSTAARALSDAAGMDMVEMDQRIEKEQEMPITEIFAVYGEAYFRDLETELIGSLAKKTGLVVSCGGGSVLREKNAALMKESGCIVLLTATPETIYERVRHSTNRPVLNGNMNVDYIRALMEKRRERYEAVADVMIPTDGRTIREIAADILEQCGRLDRAGIRYSFFYLTGISGAGRGVAGAKATAAVCSQLHPTLIGANMMTIYPDSELYQEIQRGAWAEESETEKYKEVRTLVENLNIPTVFAALGASNAFQMQAELPRDRQKLLDFLDHVIEDVGEDELRRYRESVHHL